MLHHLNVYKVLLSLQVNLFSWQLVELFLLKLILESFLFVVISYLKVA